MLRKSKTKTNETQSIQFLTEEEKKLFLTIAPNFKYIICSGDVNYFKISFWLDIEVICEYTIYDSNIYKFQGLNFDGFRKYSRKELGL